MVIPINIEPSQIIKTYLLCLNPMMKLKRRELEALEAMLKVYISLKRKQSQHGMTNEEIDKRLDDPMGRTVIRELIGMSQASYDNHLCQLKKKKVVTKKGELETFLKNIESEVSNATFNIDYKIKVAKKEVKEVKEAHV